MTLSRKAQFCIAAGAIGAIAIGAHVWVNLPKDLFNEHGGVSISTSRVPLFAASENPDCIAPKDALANFCGHGSTPKKLILP